MSANFQTTDRPAIGEVNGLVNGLAYHAERPAKVRTVYWTAEGLRITRFRLLSDPGFPWWDVSYCHGMIGKEHVDVQLPFSQLPKCSTKFHLVQYAAKDGVHAKRIGMLDCLSTLC